MSWYTTYYLCWQDKDGKVRPLGPFNYRGDLMSVISTSRSFTTDLKEVFDPLPDEAWTEELEKEFSYEGYDDDKRRYDLEYLPLKDLPRGSYLKAGYYLIDDIDTYLKSKTDDSVYFDGFYDSLSSEAYMRKMENELKFGPPKPQQDCEGETYTPHSCADYAYFMYPEYQSKEYEAYLLRTVADILDDYRMPEGSQIVVIKTEG